MSNPLIYKVLFIFSVKLKIYLHQVKDTKINSTESCKCQGQNLKKCQIYYKLLTNKHKYAIIYSQQKGGICLWEQMKVCT